MLQRSVSKHWPLASDAFADLSGLEAHLRGNVEPVKTPSASIYAAIQTIRDPA